MDRYSISECHDVSVAVLEKFDSTSGKTQRQLRQYASCGKVMENVKCYVLDPSSLRNQPIGTPGEVYVGGPCLAIGSVIVLAIQCSSSVVVEVLQLLRNDVLRARLILPSSFSLRACGQVPEHAGKNC